jgi:hypothetical protein
LGAISSPHYSELTKIFRDYTSFWKVSRGPNGELFPLTPETDIGTHSDDIPSRSLTDVIDDFCKQGVAVRFLSDLEQLDEGLKGDSDYRGISRAVKRYKRVMAEMSERREGRKPFRVPRSDYVDFIRQDEELLSSLRVNLNSTKLADLFPSRPDVVPGRSHNGSDQVTLGQSDTLYLIVSA